MMDDILYPHPLPFPTQKTEKLSRAPHENGRDPYDALRPWSAITHGAGAMMALMGTILLLLLCNALDSTVWHYMTFCVYGFSLVTLYTASTLYHCIRTCVKGRIALRKFDHTSIYLLIAGTYTPICLIPLRGPWGWSLFGVIWGLALVGLVLSLLWIQAPRWVTAGIYIFMGWLALIAIYPLAQVLSGKGLFWLLSGGILYTIGGLLYALKWPGRNRPRFGCHEVFHVFIVLGSICHYFLMYRVISVL